MKRTISMLLAIVLVLALAACGGDDDAGPTATTEAAAPDATSTTSAGAPTATNGPASPTATGSASPTGEPDASPETGHFTDEEAGLLDLLLAESDLPGDWTQLRVEAPELSESPGICDAPRFPGATERIAEVEVEYQSADGARFVLQNLTQIPEEVAVEAMDYIRETATCPKWTDDTGTTFNISPVEAPDLGDDAHVIHVSFQVADAGTLEGDFVFVRIGGYVTIVTTLALGDYDPAFATEVATIAASKIGTLTGAGPTVTDEESALIEGLLTLDDLEGEWDQAQPAHRSEPENWTGLCDAELFPDHEQALARVVVEFYEGFEAESASLMQLLIAYPPGLAEAAFVHERESVACERFTRGETGVTVEPAETFPTFGDQSFAVHYTIDTGEATAEGYWIVIRVGGKLTTLIYTDPDGLDKADAEAIAQAAAGKIAEVSP